MTLRPRKIRNKNRANNALIGWAMLSLLFLLVNSACASLGSKDTTVGDATAAADSAIDISTAPAPTSESPVATVTATAAAAETATATATIPTATATSPPATHAYVPPKVVTGRARLHSSVHDEPTSAIDLDTGNVTGPDDPAADIQYFAELASMFSDTVFTLNGATAKVYQLETITTQDCAARQGEFIEHNTIPDFSSGYICVLTNLGNLSVVHMVDYFLLPEEGWIEIEYYTKIPPPEGAGSD